MTTETILTYSQIEELWLDHGYFEDFARAIEQAVLQSPEIQAWKRDAADCLETLRNPEGEPHDNQKAGDDDVGQKNKYLRAFLHQTQNPTIEQAWDAAWKHAQKTFHARSMQDMEEQIAIERDYSKALEKRVADLEQQPAPDVSGLVETLEDIAKVARAALAEHRKQGVSNE